MVLLDFNSGDNSSQLLVQYNWCIFCLRSCDSKRVSESKDATNAKFLRNILKLLLRHINYSASEVFELEQIVIGFGPCQDCLFLLQEFHNFYQEIKLSEMKMNWKLDMLIRIMNSAGKVPSRIKALKTSTNKELFNKMQSLRSSLERKVSAKLKSTHPNLQLQRCDADIHLGTALNLQESSKTTVVSKFEETNPDTTSHNQQHPAMEDIFPEVSKNESGKLLSSAISKIDFCSASEITEEVAPEIPGILTDTADNIHDCQDEDLQDLIASPPPLSPTGSPTDTCDNDDENSKSKSMSESKTKVICDNNAISEINLNAVLHEIIKEDDTSETVMKTSFNEVDELVTDSELFGIPDADTDDSNKTTKYFPNSPNDFHLVMSESIFESCDVDVGNTNTKTTEICVENGGNDDNDNIKVPPKSTSRRQSTSNAHDDLTDGNLNTDHPKSKPNAVLSRSNRNRGRKRKLITTRKITKTVKRSKLRHPNPETSSLPTLQQLALKRVMHLKFVCNTFPCHSRTFVNIKDYKNHLHHHGEFRCKSCDVIKSYAPDLWIHEREKHSTQFQQNDKCGNVGKCSRCEFGALTKKTIKNHFLESHLNLILDKNTCPICKMTVNRSLLLKLPYPLTQHFRTHHDLSIRKGCGTGHVCNFGDCRAFFRTDKQLSHHKCCVHYYKSASTFTPVPQEPQHQLLHCNLCKNKFQTAAQLSHHQKLWHSSGTQDSKRKRRKRPEKRWKSEIHKDYAGWIDHIFLKPEALKLFGQLKWCKNENCKKFFFTKAELRTHKKHHGNFKCNFCDEVFDYAGKLPEHEMTHLKDRSGSKSPESSHKRLFNCSRCPFSSMKIKSLICHFIETHINLLVDYGHCPICKTELYFWRRKSFRQSVQKHLKSFHDFTKITYECKENGCVAYFNTKQQLATHLYNHKFKWTNSESEDGKTKLQIKCKECGKFYKRRHQFITHYTHSHVRSDNDPPETEPDQTCICPECGKKCKTPSGLTTHISQIHKKNNRPIQTKPKKTYVCESCGMRCKNLAVLKRHGYVHMDPQFWPFKCSICDKRCMCEYNLKVHMRVHTGEKPFTCEYCGVGYQAPHNLKIHIKNQHGDATTEGATGRAEN